MPEDTTSQSFNSRTPGGVRLLKSVDNRTPEQFQFTHPGRGATDAEVVLEERREVSIHAPREGCDLTIAFTPYSFLSFNSRTPGGVRQRRSALRSCCQGGFNSRTPGGVRLEMLSLLDTTRTFQFTHPGRGATTTAQRIVLSHRCFNSRTPGGVRHCPPRRRSRSYLVSIHAPREGCDLTILLMMSDTLVSIHAPREGCDSAVPPRSGQKRKFQFTHPGRGATAERSWSIFSATVSIHAPREGCDLHCLFPRLCLSRFNSRTPGGVRQAQGKPRHLPSRVSIHAPREGCDTRY